MKVLITLAGTALSQTVLPETLPFGDGFGEYDLGDYSLSDYGLDAQEADVPYALLDSLADDPDAVVDYFESEDPTGRNAGGGRKPLPPGIFYRDYIRDDGTFDVQGFRQAIREAQQAQAAAEAAADVQNSEERYFFTQPATTSTTTTTTTTTPNVGTSCWKCDQMTYADCSALGDIEACEKGDKDCCFVEIREQAQQLQQLCTGCKSRNACENLRDENFHFDTNNSNGVARSNEMVYQCRPDYRQQIIGKHAAKQSVCRQCFNPCDPSDTNDAGRFCFGGAHQKNQHKLFMANLKLNENSYPWGGFYGQTNEQALGIPIARADGTTHSAIVGKVEGLDSGFLNIYFENATNGKAKNQAGDGNVDDNEMLYWGLQGADRAWWSSDLKTKATNARNNGPDDTNLA